MAPDVSATFAAIMTEIPDRLASAAQGLAAEIARYAATEPADCNLLAYIGAPPVPDAVHAHNAAICFGLLARQVVFAASPTIENRALLRVLADAWRVRLAALRGPDDAGAIVTASLTALQTSRRRRRAAAARGWLSVRELASISELEARWVRATPIAYLVEHATTERALAFTHAHRLAALAHELCDGTSRARLHALVPVSPARLRKLPPRLLADAAEIARHGRLPRYADRLTADAHALRHLAADPDDPDPLLVAIPRLRALQ